MITKLQTYPKYKNSGVDWIKTIPVDWTHDKIVSLFNFPNDKVSDEDFEPLSVTYGGVKKQVEDAAKTDHGSNRKLLKIGDIAFNGRSDRRGACGISEYEGSISIVYHVLRKKSANVYTRFYHHLFRSTLFSQEFYRWGRGIHDDMWTTRIMEMKRIQVPVPPPETQQRIANFLDEKTQIIDGLVAKKEQLIELFRKKRTAIITNAVTKGLDPKVKMKPSGIDWLGDIPEGWEVKRLRFVIKSNPSKQEIKAKTLDSEVSFIPMEAVSEDGSIDLSTTKTLQEVIVGYTYFRDGDVVIAKITPCFENGKGAIMENLTNGIGFGTTEFHVLRSAKINNVYLYLITNIYQFRTFGEVNMKGVAGQKRVPEEFIKDFTIGLPNIPEQVAIADFIVSKTAKIDEVVKNMETQIEKLQEYRSSLIYSAVTGKIKI
jgi:type I restriction enzyme S subunit